MTNKILNQLLIAELDVDIKDAVDPTEPDNLLLALALQQARYQRWTVECLEQINRRVADTYQRMT